MRVLATKIGANSLPTVTMKPKAPDLRQAIDSLFALGPATHDTYTRLALRCVRANDVGSAWRLQTHMDRHLYYPKDAFLHNRILHLYAKLGALSDARNLFDEMPHRDVFSWNAMLLLYARFGTVEELRNVFDGMPSPDPVSFNTVISGFLRNGCGALAVGAFVTMIREGFEPMEYTHVSILSACTQLSDLRMGKQVHGRILTGTSRCNVFVWNALIDMYAKCGEIDRARWLFDRMSGKNVVSWNLIIYGYLRNWQPEKSIELFNVMQNLGLEPDQFTLSNILQAYVQNGSVDEARKLFLKIKDKDKICWTTMIVGYAQKEKEEDALNLFRDMLRQNIRPDSHTLSNVISCIARLASLNHGQAVHGKAFLIGVQDDLLVSGTLIEMYCKCGVLTDAWALFSTVPFRSVVSWNAMIRGYTQNGQDLEALNLYDKMLEENLKPDDITFVSVLSACSHTGLVEKGNSYFDSMRELHGLEPTLDHYACMVSLLGRSINLDKAVELINSMPQKPNDIIWSTVLSISTMKKDIHHGEMAARCLFELDPLNALPYIMLSNIYASCGRWKDVASTRALMKRRSIKKLAAYSWINIDNELHKFVADDRTHPETKIIYTELNSLINDLQRAGFVPNTGLVLHNVAEEEKFESICYHSEKIALAFGLSRKRHSVTPIRIMKNIRVCGDCHEFMKFVSKSKGRLIILRDATRFHHFDAGQCSCKDAW